VKTRLSAKEDQTLWLSQLPNKPKPLFIEIWKNASRFTEFLCQSIDMKDPPTFAVIRDPYTRFWSACKEIFSNPAKDGTPRGETNPIRLIEYGLIELQRPDLDFHFQTQTWFKNLYPWELDHVFLFESLNQNLKQKCDEFNVIWKDAFDWEKALNMNINPSDHTNDETAIEFLKDLPEIKYYYEEDFEWYNSVINNNL